MEILDYYRKIQLEASQDAYKSTCHYLVIKNGNPHPYASGVFIKVDEQKFMITAAHVVDDNKEDLFIGVDKHELLKLGGELTKNVAPRQREEDTIDISILKLNEETIEKLGDKYEFIDSNELGINHSFQLLPMYTSVGFPASKSKYNSYKDEIRSRPFIYTTSPAKEAIYEKLKYESFSNVIVHYDRKKVKSDPDGPFSIGPDPKGISGSGLWYTPRQVKIKDKRVDKSLMAIMTECPIENRKFLIGTRIDIITEVIRQKYKLSLEISKVVKVNL